MQKETVPECPHRYAEECKENTKNMLSQLSDSLQYLGEITNCATYNNNNHSACYTEGTKGKYIF